MAEPAEGRVVPFQRYYLCIDGTPAVDSVEYGRSLEKMFGWRNLLVEFLQPVPSEAGTEPGTPPRLHDPNHPYLPIYAFPVTDRKPVAVVCPSGLHGRGLDEFWRAYKGETPEEQQNHGKVDWPKGPSGTRGVTYGRYSALEKCARFMPDLILSPTIEHVSRNGKDFAQLKQGHLPGSRHDPPQADIHAQLLFVSSHGWKAGFMRGDNMQEDKTAEPKDAQYAFTAGYYFMAGYAAEAGLFFNGPKWVILAQCSTVNQSTWVLWAKVMAKSIPNVHGILAYEEISPNPNDSVTIARTFFDNLRAGQTILNAWRNANKLQKWSAVVHKDALEDFIQKWDELPKLENALVTADESSYIGFAASAPRQGVVVFDRPPDFGMKLERSVEVEKGVDPETKIPDDPAEWHPITPANVHMGIADLADRGWVRMTVTAPAGKKIRRATIRWIHIRESYRVQPPLTKLFSHQLLRPSDAIRRFADGNRALVIGPFAGPTDNIVALFYPVAPDDIPKAGLEAHHAYLWPLIELELEGEKLPLTHRFQSQGLKY